MATLAQNIQRAIDDFDTIEDAIVRKGVPVPEGTPTSEYGEKILSIETGVDTSGDTVVPSALREGYTAHNAAGQEITGTIPNYDGSITEGAVPGAEAKYEEGVADGKQAEYDAFWDAYQENGERTVYAHGFSGRGWDEITFAPKYDIKPTEVYMMFAGCAIKDIPSSVEKAGVSLDFSNCSKNFNYLVFSNLETEHFGVIDTRKADKLEQIMNNARVMKKVDKLILRDNGSQQFNSSPFIHCVALEDFTVEGKVGSNNFNMSWSPLNKASLTSIVNALSSTTTGLTVTLRLAAVNTAFETAQGSADGSSSEEWLNLIATKSNWTINLINS